MYKFPKIIWLASILLVFISCSYNERPSSSVQARSYDYEEKDNFSALVDPASDRFIIPPEVAVMSGKMTSSSSSFDKTSKLLVTGAKEFLSNVNSIENCSAKITDYRHPAVNKSSKVSLSNKNRYLGNLKLEILISFAKTQDINQRIQQLNSCLQAIPQLKVEQAESDKNARIDLFLSQVMPTIKQASKYRKELLEFKFKSLKEVGSISNPATQFNASDTKCTSKGIVQVVNRSLSGIELDVDFDCRRFVNEKLIIEKE